VSVGRAPKNVLTFFSSGPKEVLFRGIVKTEGKNACGSQKKCLKFPEKNSRRGRISGEQK